MLECLSRGERLEIDEARRAGHAWARVVALFEEGGRLRLGIGAARSEREIAAAAGIGAAEVRAAIAAAARWAGAHGLHLLGFPPEGAGEDPGEGWRHFLAVG